MEGQKEITKKVFDAMVHGAIEDLRKSGLDNEEIFLIIEEQFGLRYAREFCKQWWVKGKVKKIIIFSNQAKTDEGFLKLLNALFPECEIHIVSHNTENFGNAHVTKEDTSTDEKVKKNSKYS